jgi:hypothetical protein
MVMPPRIELKELMEPMGTRTDLGLALSAAKLLVDVVLDDLEGLDFGGLKGHDKLPLLGSWVEWETLVGFEIVINVKEIETLARERYFVGFEG